MKSNVCDTIDTFIAAVPEGEHRMILLYRRQHGGREFVRWRVWHRHRRRGCWCPDKRRIFVIPLALAGALADALGDAGAGRSSPMPDWLAKVEASRDRRLATLENLCAPTSLLVKEYRNRLRAHGESTPRR